MVYISTHYGQELIVTDTPEHHEGNNAPNPFPMHLGKALILWFDAGAPSWADIAIMETYRILSDHIISKKLCMNQLFIFISCQFSSCLLAVLFCLFHCCAIWFLTWQIETMSLPNSRQHGWMLSLLWQWKTSLEISVVSVSVEGPTQNDTLTKIWQKLHFGAKM